MVAGEAGVSRQGSDASVGNSGFTDGGPGDLGLALGAGADGLPPHEAATGGAHGSPSDGPAPPLDPERASPPHATERAAPTPGNNSGQGGAKGEEAADPSLPEFVPSVQALRDPGEEASGATHAAEQAAKQAVERLEGAPAVQAPVPPLHLLDELMVARRSIQAQIAAVVSRAHRCPPPHDHNHRASERSSSRLFCSP